MTSPIDITAQVTQLIQVVTPSPSLDLPNGLVGEDIVSITIAVQAPGPSLVVRSYRRDVNGNVVVDGSGMPSASDYGVDSITVDPDKIALINPPVTPS